MSENPVTEDDRDAADAASQRLPAAVEAALSDVGRGQQTPQLVMDERQRAVRAAYWHLREAGTADAAALQAAAADAAHIRLAGFDDPADLWDECVRDALLDLPGVDRPADRTTTYRYTPES